MAATAIPNEQDEYLGSTATARELEASSEAVRWWVRKGLLPCFKTTEGRMIFIRRDVLEFKRARKAAAR